MCYRLGFHPLAIPRDSSFVNHGLDMAEYMYSCSSPNQMITPVDFTTVDNTPLVQCILNMIIFSPFSMRKKEN